MNSYAPEFDLDCYPQDIESLEDFSLQTLDPIYWEAE